MLQLLLAILTILLVAASGLGVFTQLQVQEVFQYQSETIRRLDTAARAIEGRIYRDGDSGRVLAPAPLDVNYMPAGTGSINETVKGVKFTYCPVFVKSQDGVVLNSALPEKVTNGMGVAAVILAPTYQRTDDSQGVRPSCSDVQVDDVSGKIFAANAYVRVVNSNAAVMTASSTGDLDAILASFNPSSTVTTNVLIAPGASISPSGSAWASFVSKLQFAKAPVRFAGGGALVLPDGVSAISAPSSLVFDGIALQNLRVSILSGSSVTVSNAGFAANGSSPIFAVESGGRLTLAGDVYFSGALSTPIVSSGDVVLSRANVRTTSDMGSSIVLQGGSRFMAQSSMLGDPGSRVQSSAIVESGAFSIQSDATSGIAAGSGGGCWSSSMPAFAYSSALNSVVEPGVPDPGAADPGHDAWIVDQAARARARVVNQSALSCN